MEQAAAQLNEYGITFERWAAIKHTKGAEGLRLTMQNLFQHCVKNNYQNVLIMEDDLDIIEPEINEVMDEVVKHFPQSYDIIYLGCQLCTTPKGFYNNNLLNGIRNAYATHAAIYSKKAMQTLLNNNFYAPIDNAIVATLQKDNNCYVVYPMLCSQIVSHSDIYDDIPVMDWRKYLQIRYWEQMTAMKESGTFNTNSKQYNG